MSFRWPFRTRLVVPGRRLHNRAPIAGTSLSALLLVLFGCSDPVSPRTPFASLTPIPASISAPDPNPWAPGLWVADWTPNTCGQPGQFNDLDYDGIHDGCENGLAQYFAPLMVADPDCVWDTGNGRLGGDYAYAVEYRTQGAPGYRIVYMPAYYRDCGASNIGEHNGDSEFAIVDVEYDATTQHWLTVGLFLSAHCGVEGWGGACRWHGLTDASWYQDRGRGAPEIWVAKYKHALYKNSDWCSYRTDECPSGLNYHRFPVQYVQQNIGSQWHPLPWRSDAVGDCAPPLLSSALLTQWNPNAGSTRECWWSVSRVVNGVERPIYFHGWLGNDGSTTTPYGVPLAMEAGFAAPYMPPPDPGTTGGVDLNGPSLINTSDRGCYWTAYATEGTAPFTYEFYANGYRMFADGNTFIGDNAGQPFTLLAVIIDGNGTRRSASMSVSTDPNAMHCTI